MDHQEGGGVEDGYSQPDREEEIWHGDYFE